MDVYLSLGRTTVSAGEPPFEPNETSFKSFAKNNNEEVGAVSVFDENE